MTGAMPVHRDQVAPRGGSAIEAFRQAICASELQPPEEVIADGELHRFASNGKSGDDAGWYVLHLDGIPAGRFGCHRAQVNQKWMATLERTLTEAERAAYKVKMDATRKARDRDKAQRQAEAATEARRIWVQYSS